MVVVIEGHDDGCKRPFKGDDCRDNHLLVRIETAVRVAFTLKLDARLAVCR